MIPQMEITYEAALRDLEHGDWRVRARAAGALGSAADGDRDGATRALRGALRDDRGEVRFAAAMSLAELRDGLAVKPLIDQLDDGDPRAREAAALALGRIGDVAAWDALARALADGPPEVRFQAAASLAEIDAARAAPLLRTALGDSDQEVRASVATALADAPREDETVEALAKLLAGERFEDARFEAAFALARHGDRRATPTLIVFLEHPTHALDAAQALANLRDPSSAEALRRVLRRWFAPALVKVAAANALAQLGDAAGREHLERAARARRDDVRGLAKEYLDELGHH